MIDTVELDAAAAVLFTLGRFHRQAPDSEALGAFWELAEEWPLPIDATTKAGLAEFTQSRTESESAASIRTDHNWLYGVSATAKIPPYESVHRDREGLLFDQQTLAVRKIYRSIGLEVPELNRVPDDHIGTEMDFVAQCFVRALDAADAADDKATTAYLQLAASFLDEHVSQWAPEVLAQAADLADTHFMRGVCLCSIAALTFSGDLLDRTV